MEKRYKRTPTIYQMESAECGVACLAMILAFYGRWISFEQLRVETGVSRDGCNAWNLLCAGEKFGLIAKGYRKSMQSLLQLEPPCVIHWEYNHFVVFEGCRGKYCYINDPAVGRRKLSYEELEQSFTGIVLVYKKNNNFKISRKKQFFSGTVRTWLSEYKRMLVILMILGVLLTVPGLLMPLFLQYFIDEILGDRHAERLFTFLAAYGGVMSVQVGLTFYRSFLLLKLKNRFVYASTSKFLFHMLRLPIPFYEQRYAGDLVERVQNNEDVNIFLVEDLAEVLLNLFVIVFYLILLILYSPWLTLLCMVVTGSNLILMAITFQQQRAAAVKWQIVQGKLMGNLCAGLTLTTNLKACGAQKQYAAYLQSCYDKVIREDQSVGRIQQILNAVTESLQIILNVLTLLAGGILVMQGVLTAGMLTAYLGLLASFTEPIQKLVGFAGKIRTVGAELSRVEDLMCCRQDQSFDREVLEYNPTKSFDREASKGSSTQDTDKQMSEHNFVHDLERAELEQNSAQFQGQLELYNVSFGYNINKEPLLNRFHLCVNEGVFLVLTGKSGCGKSTIAKIAGGLYHPWEGQVLLDGTSLEKIPREILNANLSLVGQEMTLFSGTVWENITMWRHDILESDVIEAAKDACIHDFILTKPEGYYYRLQERGRDLSGGQCQRLEIARALAVNPKVLILDEATSALELSLERQIIQNIRRRGCTCLMITHRLSAVFDHDQIVVVE